MKKYLLSLIFALIAANMNAQEVKKLPQPDMQINVSLTEALQKRRSDRDFKADGSISDQQLSQLLWAACGVNRADRKLLTIPPSMPRTFKSMYAVKMASRFISLTTIAW